VCFEVVWLFEVLAKGDMVINFTVDRQNDTVIMVGQRLGARVCPKKKKKKS
jgi:hypothetical protein